MRAHTVRCTSSIAITVAGNQTIALYGLSKGRLDNLATKITMIDIEAKVTIKIVRGINV